MPYTLRATRRAATYLAHAALYADHAETEAAEAKQAALAGDVDGAARHAEQADVFLGKTFNAADSCADYATTRATENAGWAHFFRASAAVNAANYAAGRMAHIEATLAAFAAERAA